jgi:hypothetical protein
MNKDLEELKQKINDLDEYSKLYILGFIQGQLYDLKKFGDEE